MLHNTDAWTLCRVFDLSSHLFTNQKECCCRSPFVLNRATRTCKRTSVIKSATLIYIMVLNLLDQTVPEKYGLNRRRGRDGFNRYLIMSNRITIITENRPNDFIKTLNHIAIITRRLRFRVAVGTPRRNG